MPRPTKKQRTWSAAAFQRKLLARVSRLPPTWVGKLPGGPPDVDGRALEPVMRLLAGVASRRRQYDAVSLPRARAELAARVELVSGETPLLESIEDVRIPAEGRSIEARIYTPPDPPKRSPALVFFHGGGWVLGDLDTHHQLCAVIALETPCKVISVGYRLAPEHEYPAGVDDALAAFRWTVEEAPRLRVDPDRVAVGGDSAGGNFAAVVCQRSRDAGPAPCAQLLLYPSADGRRESGSQSAFASGYGLSREDLDWFYGHYLADPSQVLDPGVSPLLAESLEGLPPALVMTAGFDVLRDEGEAYARRLEAAGVDVWFEEASGLIHGFASMTGLPSGRRALDAAVGELARLFRDLARDSA